MGPKDLERLQVLHDLLTTLNDPYASRKPIQKYCEAIPVLAARILQHARSQLVPQRDVDSLEHALGIIGNRGLEFVLFQLLEDLTLYKAERDEFLESTAPKVT